MNFVELGNFLGMKGEHVALIWKTFSMQLFSCMYFYLRE